MPGSVIWKGDQLGRLVEDVPNVIKINRFGIGAATLNYQCRFASAASLVLRIDRHPDYNWLIRSEAIITREEQDLALVSIDFEGVPVEEQSGPNANGYKYYSLRGTNSTEKITSHPNFKDIAADTAHGAKFDSDGRFIGFTNKESRKYDVTSYLMPGVIYEENIVRSAASVDSIAVTMNNLGKIDNPPNSSVKPETASGRNWLLNGAEVSEIGDGIQQQRNWLISGPLGWDPDWYD